MSAAGEEDWHDKVVSQYKDRITARYDLERQIREERRRLLQKKYDEMELDTRPQPLVGYTPAQLSQMLQGRQPGVATIQTHDPRGTKERMYHRHLHLAEKGLLQATEDGKLLAPETDPSLMDMISDRKVPYKVEE